MTLRCWRSDDFNPELLNPGLRRGLVYGVLQRAAADPLLKPPTITRIAEGMPRSGTPGFRLSLSRLPTFPGTIETLRV